MQISYLRTMSYLLATQLIVFRQTIHDKFIDLFIWVIAMAAVTIYLLPSFGLEMTYGSFIIASMAASAGIFEQFTSTTNLIADFNGDNITSFYLTLPMPSWLVFLSYALFYLCNTAVLTFFVVPIAKLCFWHHLDLSQLHIGKYLLMMCAMSSFYASFTLWMASKVPTLERIGSIWMRFIFPLWTFGAFQYSYAVLKQVSTPFAYLSLLNPMVYIMEGTRAAILGQTGSLNFWVCLGMTIVFAFLCGFDGIRRIKKRLDFV